MKTLKKIICSIFCFVLLACIPLSAMACSYSKTTYPTNTITVYTLRAGGTTTTYSWGGTNNHPSYTYSENNYNYTHSGTLYKYAVTAGATTTTTYSSGTYTKRTITTYYGTYIGTIKNSTCSGGWAV